MVGSTVSTLSEFGATARTKTNAVICSRVLTPAA
jgi:hypothetical protein